jgi:hypothetical protein
MQCLEAGRTNAMTEFHAETLPDERLNLLPGRVLVANPFAVRANRDDPRHGLEAFDHMAQPFDALVVFQLFSFGSRGPTNLDRKSGALSDPPLGLY